MSLEKLAAAKEFDIEVYSRQEDLPSGDPGDRAFVIEDKEFFVYHSGSSAPGDNDSEGWYPAQAVNRNLTEVSEDLTALEKRANPSADLPDGVDFQGHGNAAHFPDSNKAYATESYADTAYEDDDAVAAANGALNQHSSLSTLSDAVAGKPDSKMTDSEAVSAVNNELPEHGDVTDLSNEVNNHDSRISGKADDNHGNGAHSDDFATESWVSANYADDYHDNSDHSQNYATTSWVSNNYADDYHGNSDHRQNYATTNYVDRRVTSVDPGISHPGETPAESSIDMAGNNITGMNAIYAAGSSGVNNNGVLDVECNMDLSGAPYDNEIKNCASLTFSYNNVKLYDYTSQLNVSNGSFNVWDGGIEASSASIGGNTTINGDLNINGNVTSNIDMNSNHITDVTHIENTSNDSDSIYIDASKSSLNLSQMSYYDCDASMFGDDQPYILRIFGLVGSGGLKVDGDLDVDGELTASSVGSSVKSFIIDHPSKEGYELEHTSYEGPTSGGLIYRDRVEVVNGTGDPEFPDYVTEDGFGGDWVTSITPAENITEGYYLDTGEWTLYADEDGEYDVVIFGQRTDDTALEGRGGITERRNDETWDMAADRYYGGANDVRGIETARDVEDMRDQALVSHAQKEDKQTEFTATESPMGADPEVTAKERVGEITDQLGVEEEEAIKIIEISERENVDDAEAYDIFAKKELKKELMGDSEYVGLNENLANEMARMIRDEGMTKDNAYEQIQQRSDVDESRFREGDIDREEPDIFDESENSSEE